MEDIDNNGLADVDLEEALLDDVEVEENIDLAELEEDVDENEKDANEVDHDSFDDVDHL